MERVRSVEVGKVKKPSAREEEHEHNYNALLHLACPSDNQTHMGCALAKDLDIKPGKTYTLIAVEHPDPPKEECPRFQRRECAKVERPHYGICPYLCANCSKPASEKTLCCGTCGCRFTETITWAKFTQRDC